VVGKGKPGGMLNVAAFHVVSFDPHTNTTDDRCLRFSSMFEALVVVGASHRRITFRHILPNAPSPIISTASLPVAVSVIAEASLSYLGLGTQPPTPSWGLDPNKALGYLDVNLWMALGPGIAILIAATAFNLLGDGLRDLLDPRLRNR
jgi:peptide/nickel transport system permease protein